MNEIWNSRVRKMLHLCMFFAIFISFSSSCQAAVDCSKYSGAKRQQCTMKKTYKLDVTTLDDNGNTKHWYVSNDNTLHSYVVCEDESGKQAISSNYSAFNPCDRNNEHDNYYSTDNDRDNSLVTPMERDFTIAVSAASYNTTMSNIRIEWMNGTKYPPDSWASARSRTCSGGTCTICREGGSCNYKDIYPSEISANPDGSQNVLWFRVIITDNANTPNSITTGWDNYLSGWTNDNVPPRLDRYYRFVFCTDICPGTKCNKDGHVTPVIKSMNVTNKCAENKPYVFNWTIDSHDIGHDGQSMFRIEIIDAVTKEEVFDSGEIYSNANSYTNAKFLPSGDILQYGKKYKWRLTIMDNDKDVDCQLSSFAEGYFTTCDSPNIAPAIVSTSTVSPTSCANPSDFNYTLKWEYSDANNDPQWGYQILIKDKSTNATAYSSGKIQSTAKEFKLGAGTYTLPLNKAYYWKVQVIDSYGAASDWKTGDDLPTYPWPKTSFTVDCTSGSDCYFKNPIVFTSTSTASSPTYDWYVDGNLSGVHNSVLNRIWTSGGDTHDILLSITDKYKHTCESLKQIKLKESPANIAPVVVAPSIVSPTSCAEPENFNYTLKWDYYDADDDPQSTYRVQIIDKGTGAVVYNTGDVRSTAKELKLGQDTYALSLNKTYSWRVQVADSHGTLSKWKTGDNLPTYPWPKPDFEFDCTSGSDCYLRREITFTSNSTASSPTYNWYVDGNLSGVHNSVLHRVWTSGNTHTVQLKITDKYAHTCGTLPETIQLTEGKCSTSLSLSKTKDIHTGEEITASGSASGITKAPIAYHWKLNNAAYDSSNILPTEGYLFSSAGSYKIGVYATDAEGRSCAEASQTVSVTDIDQCSTSFSLDKNSLYYGDTVNITGNVSKNTVNPVFHWTIVKSDSGSVIGDWVETPPTSFTFPESEKNASAKYIVKLHVTDDKNRSCNAKDQFVSAKKSSPKWNETIPNLSPVQLMITDLLSRISSLHF